MTRVITLLCVVACAFLATAAPVGAQSSVDSTEAQIVRLINDHRAQLGLPAVKLDTGLCKAAERHSKDMLGADYYGHDDPDGGPFFKRIRRYKKAKTVGEILGMLDGTMLGSDRPAVLMDAWLHSPPHRQNIESRKFVRVGISGLDGDYNGETAAMYTVDFSSKK